MLSKHEGVHNIFRSSTERLYSDNAKEYVCIGRDLDGEALKTFSPFFASQLNPIVERVNLILEDAMGTFLNQPNLPACHRSFAVKHSAYLRDQAPHLSAGLTPLSVFCGEKPNLESIRVFRYAAYVLDQSSISKSPPKAKEDVFIEALK